MSDTSTSAPFGQDAPRAQCGPWRGGTAALHFGDPAAEYRSLTAGIGVCDLSDRTQLEWRGADRATFLHGFCTNDIRKLAPGTGCEAFVTSVQGKTLGHVVVFCGPDSLVIETVPAQATKLLTHWDRYLIREDVQWTDRSATWGELLVAGAGAASLLQTLGAAPVPLGRYEHTPFRADQRGGWFRKVDAFGPHAWCVAAPRDLLPDVWQRLRRLGAEPAGRMAAEQLRLEAAWPEFGVDFDDSCLPQEIGRDEQAISFTKGCYLGQETVARIDALGHVNRQLVLVRCYAEEIPAVGTELHSAGKSVGHITSSAWSPRFGAPLALAWVRRGHEVPGSRLDSAGQSVEVIRPPAWSTDG